jgi:serine protease Do
MNFLNTIRTKKLVSSSLILFTLSIGILIGTLINTGVKAAKDTPAPGATPLVIPNPVQLSTAFSQLAKQLEPSVVNISTTYQPKQAGAQPPRGNNRRRAVPNDDGDDADDSMNDFFNRFFGSPFGGTPHGGPEGGRKGQALGSGVIVDPAGYILTNNHVVEKADRIQVTLAGNTTAKYDAKLIGADADTDLAVIKIDAHRSLSAAKIGNSDSVQVGDWAIAIGSPFGLQATVTAGIISAKDRDLDSTHQFQKFLQTDAAINPGNSGGPLLAINGDVIGINTAIVSGSGGYQGVGFALPINTAAKVYNQIIKSGKVTRGAIGVSFQEVKPELLNVYGAKEGVFVQDVTTGMPAEKAGIKREDIIIAIDGKPVKDGQDLVNRISDTPVGSSVKMTILRDKKRQDLMVKVGDRKDVVSTTFGEKPDNASAEPKSEATPAKFGISIENLNQARKDSMGFKEKGGVLVADVVTGSFAEDIGLTENDIIVSINRLPVESAADVQRIQATLKPGDPVAFHVFRAPAMAAQGRRSPGSTAAPEWRSLFVAGAMPNTP